jgi:SAM-dependent methyltransferase
MTSDSLEAAERALRASEADCLAAWEALVEAERRQVESLPDRPRPEDFYAPIAGRFRPDPDGNSDDPALALLLSVVSDGEDWLDLGAGGGRYTIPIARKARRVYAVEPSDGMRAVLDEAIAAAGLDNVEVYAERWPGPSMAPVADVGLISHVGYDIAAIGPFLDQLEAHSRHLCLALLFGPSPTSDFALLWTRVHGEARVTLPGLREFVSLLFSRGTPPEIRTQELPPRTYESLEALQAAVRRPLWVLEGSEKDKALAEAVADLAQPLDGGAYVLSKSPRVLGLVTWQPRRAAR